MSEKMILDDPSHPYWRAVYVRLNDKLVARGQCDHSLDLTTQILKSLPNVDVGGTLEFYRVHGGYCDCEVYFNVYWNEPDLRKAE